MYVETVKQKRLNKRWNQMSFFNVDVFLCDECHNRYEKRHHKNHVNSEILTFCSTQCMKISRSTGALAEKRKATCMKRYGVEFASQISDSTQKMLSTRIKKYGSVAPIHYNETISAKWHKTSIEKYGTYWLGQSDNVKDKRANTCQERYGVNNPLSTGSPFRPSHDDLSCAGQAGYRTTARQEGSWLISKPERDLVNLLKVHFGSGDIEQQKEIRLSGKKYIVDVYIKSRNIFVQLDGEFWHGLDKPYDQLHPRSKSKFDDDRIQDALFSIAGLNLVRITDAQLITWQKNNDFSFIVEKLGG